MCRRVRPSLRRCFHTLGLGLHLGKLTLPDTIDRTLLAQFSRKGAKCKAPGRGAVPILADQKDARIAQLEAQVRRLQRSKGTVSCGGQDQTKGISSASIPSQPTTLCPEAKLSEQPQRRLTCKTSFPQVPLSWEQANHMTTFSSFDKFTLSQQLECPYQIAHPPHRKGASL